MAELVEKSPSVPLRQVFRRFSPDVRPYLLPIALLLALSAVSPALETAALWAVKRLVDEVLIEQDLDDFGPLAALLVGLTLADGVAGYAERVLGARTSAGFLLGLRARLLGSMLRLSPDSLERRRLGDVLQRLSADAESVETLLVSGLYDAVGDGLRVAFFTAALFFLDARLAAIALAAVPAFAIAARRLSARMRDVAREARRRGGSALSVAEESLSAAPLVQAYGREDAELERFVREGRAGVAARIATARLRGLFAPLLDLVELAGGLAVIALGTWELSQDRITIGGLLVFVTYLGRLYSPVRHLGSYGAAAFTAAAAAERLIELLDETASGAPPSRRRVLRSPKGVVEVERVSFRYPGTTRDAVSDLSLRIAPGQTVALVGPSGSGKTTVLKLLLGFHEPASGRIRLDGEDLRDLDVRSVREAMAVVLQETLVLHATVRENIEYGRPGADDLAIRRAARAADADRFACALPAGYDTMVGQRGRRLSGGQRQRIAIARAILRGAPVLLLDEPTSGLDGSSARRVLRAMRRAMAGRATLLVSHDLSVVQEATEILVFEEGRVVERGTHGSLVASGGRYATLWQIRDAAARAAAWGERGAAP